MESHKIHVFLLFSYREAGWSPRHLGDSYSRTNSKSVYKRSKGKVITVSHEEMQAHIITTQTGNLTHGQMVGNAELKTNSPVLSRKLASQ